LMIEESPETYNSIVTVHHIPEESAEKLKKEANELEQEAERTANLADQWIRKRSPNNHSD
jgi:hypothetical protein